MNPFKKEKKQLSIFITAGYPQLESTVEQILELQKLNVDFIEVGIPFSDPMADGETIQETSAIAIQNGMNLDVLFNQLEGSKNEIQVPLVLMGYLNPVLQFGLERFLMKCQQLKIASVILPDISLELYQRFYQVKFEAYKVPVSFLITQFTSDIRIQEMARASQNSFLYLVGQSSITGEVRDQESSVKERFNEIKKLCGETPVMLGFGINNSQKVTDAHEVCDGAIVGTAYLKAVKNNQAQEFVQELIT
jgi:tryptophan synthase alpha chain